MCAVFNPSHSLLFDTKHNFQSRQGPFMPAAATALKTAVNHTTNLLHEKERRIAGYSTLRMHPPPPRVQEPAMFDRGTRGRFLRKVVLGHGGGGITDELCSPLCPLPLGWSQELSELETLAVCSCNKGHLEHIATPWHLR